MNGPGFSLSGSVILDESINLAVSLGEFKAGYTKLTSYSGEIPKVV